MEEAAPTTSEAPESAKTQPSPCKRGQKKRRRHSSEADLAKAGGGEGGGGGGGGGGVRKRPRTRVQSISSKKVANHVMKMRVRGSESDPLNLEGVSGVKELDECSTCAPSPAFGDGGQPSPLPLHLLRDPLNLEGKVKEHPGPSRAGEKHSGVRKRHGRRRTISRTEDGTGGAGKKSEHEHGGDGGQSGPAFHSPTFRPQGARYCYGNYDMYYGYRHGGVADDVADPRLKLLKREWFEGKACLDIGSNTGQVTLAIAQWFNPSKIVGVDIDPKLVRIANKNLFRHHVPLVAPDGRTFPSSFISRSSFPLPAKLRGCASHSPQPFPHNVEFVQMNYVPDSEEGVTATSPQYDVILALSITKWVHLNWGDTGIRRMFQKIYRHLRPGGRLILEPQPFASYARKKKLTPAIYKNYYAIQFFPDQFQDFLMSEEVGFSGHRFLGVPHHKSEGFKRPLHMYIKGESRGGGGGGGEGGEGGGGGEKGEREEEERGGRGGMETEAEVAGGGEERGGEERGRPGEEEDMNYTECLERTSGE